MHRMSLAAFTLVIFVGCSSLRPASPEKTGVAAPGAQNEPVVTQARRAIARYDKDPLAVRSLNSTFDTFPDASLVDFSFLLDPPAGKYGFVEARPDGHFHFMGNDKRVRFWGVTVAASHVDIPKERIREAVDVIARSGCNLLRLHELDNRGGEKYNLVRRNIIDETFPDNDISTKLDAEYRDRVDYWIACAQERGIYVYLVVLGYRTFRSGDDVQNADALGRGAKPYAIFDPRLIDLQQDYAREWLTEHINPYTGKPNGLNPAVAMIELENEDSLFFHLNWNELLVPYAREFHDSWVEWLEARYGTTAKLREAWTDARGRCCLRDDEQVEHNSVDLPRMQAKSLEEILTRPWTDPRDAPLRNQDGVRYALDVQRKYFDALRDNLRQSGCRIPLTAVVDSLFLPDTFSVAEQLDFVGENAYLDHPSFLPGEEWVGRSFFTNKNYIGETGVWGLMPHMARYKWAGRPLVCREWALCWPNEYRASGTLDIAAMSALQDYDALIHFAYYTWGNPDLIAPFGPQADPVRWGLFPYAALLFEDGALEPAKSGVAIAYNEQDLTTFGAMERPWQRLAWTQRVAEWNPDADFEKDAPKNENLTLTAVSGRGGTGQYTGNNLVLFDAHYAERAALPESQHTEGVLAKSGYDLPWIYRSGGFPVDAVTKAGFQPFLANGGKDTCRAFYDKARNTVVLADVDETLAMRVTDWFAGQLDKDTKDFKSLDATEPDVWSASGGAGGKITRDAKNGLLTIATDRVCAITGQLPADREVAAGPLTVQSQSPIASVVVAALDGRPISESRRVAVKMVTVAHNRGQDLVKVDPSKYPNAPGTVALGNYGGPPVQTEGKPSLSATTVSLAGRALVQAYLVNGSWEVVFDRDKRECFLTCDTPNIRFVVDPSAFGADNPGAVDITKYNYEYPPAPAGQSGCDFHYPGFSKYVQLQARGK